MAREQQQPMSAEELDDMHQRAAEDAGENAKADADGYELPAQQPMSDARLQEIRAGFEWMSRRFERERREYTVCESGMILLAEVERLRAREAALVEVVQAVMNDIDQEAWVRGWSTGIEQARALLASDSQS